LERVVLPRCFGLSHLVDFVELHYCFCDASESGYGASAYLRVSCEGVLSCKLVAGKSRVAPLKSLTIPRLELCAAVVGVKLARLIVDELGYELSRIVFWTDSTSVLQYVTNKSRRFHRFVANRLSVIHEFSKPSQWRHVDSARNAADVASRGLWPDQIDSAPALLWFNAPRFLLQSEAEWPVCPAVLKLSDVDPEVKRTCVVVAAVEPESGIVQLLSRYSCFVRLQRAFAWLKRFACFFRNRYSRSVSRVLSVGPLKSCEREAAVLDIVKLVQRQYFCDIVECVPRYSDFPVHLSREGCRGLSWKRSRSMFRLRPILVNGVSRVGGRLSCSLLSYDCKFPIILPRRCVVTGLVVDLYHRREGHSGAQHVLSAVREKFWVVHGLSRVRHYIGSCRACRLWKAKVGKQMMAPLPPPRITTGNPPFTNTGVDYMGPFPVKSGRNTLKRYGCVFTCMASRAIHIEVAHSLDTSSFIQALRRFLCPRGV
ncbi:uncharacterized protein LOC144749516, partial [Ciona intestinalis]